MLNLTFKQKIITSLVLVGVLPAILIGSVATWRQMTNLTHATEVEMEEISHVKAEMVAERMNFFVQQVETTAHSPYTKNVFKAMNGAVKAYTPKDSDINEKALRARYTYQAENTAGATMADVNRWMPKSDTAKALQSLYIGNDTHPIGAKEKLDDAGDGSVYSLYHKKHHPYQREVLEKFGFYDIFLVEPTEGRIVYSVFKEVDFMMPLFTGPYKNTNFARVVKRAITEDAVIVEDFEAYEPSYGAAASFIAAPIKEQGNIIGVYVAQVPAPSDIFKEPKSGPKSFESYITSTDGYMRTNSYRLEEDTVGKKIESDALVLMQTKDHAILEGKNYHGNEALTGFYKVELDQVDWVVVSEVERAEFMSNIYKLIVEMLIILAAMVGAIVVIGFVLSRTLLKPVEEINTNFASSSTSLSSATQQIGGAMQNMLEATESARTSGGTVRESSSEASRNVAAVASAVEELNISINDISRSITESNTLIDQAVEQAQQTDAVVKKLGEAGARISDVIQLINNLAEQTNLLALNAAIEAARAGDAGRGFAVVADEVKKLASHTSEATSDITDQVKNIQEVSDETMAALKSVMEAIHQIRDSSTTVSAAVEEQGSVTQEISASVQEAANRVDLVDQNMGNVDHANQETSTATEQVSSALASMENEFKSMQNNLKDTLNKMGLKT